MGGSQWQDVSVVVTRRATTVLKAVVLFACETLLFMAVNIGGFIIAFTFA